MIYYLDTTPEELQDYVNNHGKETIEDLFSKLIDSNRNVRHLFILSNRKLIEWAIKNLELSRNNKNHLTSVVQKYTAESELYIKRAKKYLRIIIGNNSIKIESDKKVFCIGHKNFIKGNYSNVATSFIVESVKSDGKIYKHIFNEIRMVIHLPAINFNLIDGNGSKTVHVFENEIKKLMVVTCVIDSDNAGVPKKYGSTARSFVKIIKNKLSASPSFIGDVIYTIGHEVENYIPYYIGKNLLGEKNLEKLNSKIPLTKTDAEKERLWLALDIKETFENINMIDRFFNDKNKTAINDFHRFVRKDSEWKKVFLETFEDFLWFFVAPKNRV